MVEEKAKEEEKEKKENENKQEQNELKEVEIEYIIDKKKPAKKTSESTSAKKEKTEEQEEIKSLKKKLKKKDENLEELNRKVEKLREEVLRQMADKENLRKRLEKEKNEYYQFALSEFIKDILGIMDNFERALKSQDNQQSGSLKEGVAMIYKQLKDLLSRQGVKPIEIEDKRFDPRLHQAFVTDESDDVKEIEIDEELQKGYLLHGRLLRPTLVKVKLPRKKEE